MHRSRTVTTPSLGRTVAKVRLKKISKDEPAFFRWLGAIQVGPGSIDDDIREARRSRGKAARHR